MYQEIEEMRKFYNCLSDTCFFFIPTGAPGAANYASYIYWSLRGMEVKDGPYEPTGRKIYWLCNRPYWV